MAQPNSQLPSHTGSGFRKGRKWIKRSTSKKARRQGKALMEDVPPRVTQGWTD